MAYSSFSLAGVKKAFQLTEQPTSLFGAIEAISPSQWLMETLDTSLKLARSSSSEKARSEFIVAPILLELEKRNQETFSIFSGERLDVDVERGLKGECDFILSNGPIVSTVQAPIFCMVEAKKNDIKEGLGQGIAQMLGAQLFNKQENSHITTVDGCVTTGEMWQFLRLEGNTILVDQDRYYINELGKLLAALQAVIDRYQAL